MASSGSHRLVPLNASEQAEVDKFYAPFPNNSSRIMPGEWTTSSRLPLDVIQNLEVYDDDIWIVTPPKCGTTWMQELTWLICHDVDLKKAEINQFFRIPFLELGYMMPEFLMQKEAPGLCQAAGISDWKTPPGPEIPKNEETVRLFMFHSLETVRNMPRPRFIKTHLPISVLPKKIFDTCKVIYVGRNAKDACVSFFHHMRLAGFNGNFTEFADHFKRGLVFYTPLIPHMLEAWNERHRPNFFFTTYEEMSENLRSVAIRLIRFLGKDENKIDMDKLLRAVHIDSFRTNKYVNKEKEIPPDGKGTFIRKGQVGDWKNHFDAAMNAEWDPWIAEQVKGTDFKMVFE